MKQYVITLTEAEDKALSCVALSQQDWIDNAVHSRCEVAMSEIISNEVNRRISSGETIPSSRDQIVLEAIVETVAERNARIEAEMTARIAEQAANAPHTI